MRKNSKFKGTEQDLEKLIRDTLPKFISDHAWLDNTKDKVTEQEFTNICEAIAEAINRGYIEDKINVHYMFNGTISFSHLDTAPLDKPHPYKLSESGINFLNIQHAIEA